MLPQTVCVCQERANQQLSGVRRECRTMLEAKIKKLIKVCPASEVFILILSTCYNTLLFTRTLFVHTAFLFLLLQCDFLLQAGYRMHLALYAEASKAVGLLCRSYCVLQEQMNVWIQKVVDHIIILSPQQELSKRRAYGCLWCGKDFDNLGRLCKHHLAATCGKDSSRSSQCMRLGLQVSGMAVNQADPCL